MIRSLILAGAAALALSACTADKQTSAEAITSGLGTKFLLAADQVCKKDAALQPMVAADLATISVMMSMFPQVAPAGVVVQTGTVIDQALLHPYLVKLCAALALPPGILPLDAAPAPAAVTPAHS